MKSKASLLLLVSALFTLSSCTSEKSGDDIFSFDEIPVLQPRQLVQIEAIDEYYLTHLSYGSAALSDGSVLVGDRELKKLFHISAEGKLLGIAARGGRGPGEVQDVIRMSGTHNGETLLYDPMNAKLLRFSPDGVFIGEYIFPQLEYGRLQDVVQLDDDRYLLFYPLTDYLYNPDELAQTHVVVYDKGSAEHKLFTSLPDAKFAPHTINGQVVGGRFVPFTSGHLRSFNTVSGTFYVMQPGEAKITIMNTEPDTIDTIPFNLEPERINEEELASIRADVSHEMWRSMQPLLPEYKAMASSMMTDPNGNIWLRLNHRSVMHHWLIISPEGEHKALVQLPEEAMLTHISGHHLGVRLDHHQFALFEAVDL